MKSLTPKLTFALFGLLVVAASVCGQESPVAPSEPQQADAQYAQQQSLAQLEQLVAPIALYPDELVGQILTASTYPTEVVEASRWMHQHPGLEGTPLADAVDQQPWDPSVKALTEFPSLLDNMNENLSWTSALGDAYVNEPEDVMNAVQALRQSAQAAGTLKSTSQQTVATEGDSIVIEPADPAVVYVPAYDPWLVYGVPLAAYPDWIAIPGVFYAGPDLYFGGGFDIGPVARFAWWSHEWHCDWHHREVQYHHRPYFTHSQTFLVRPVFEPGHTRFARGGVPLARPERHFDHPPDVHAPAPEFHSAAPDSRAPELRPGAFSGFDHGGVARTYADRGLSSFGGHPGGFERDGSAGSFHAGRSYAGGFHGGGGRR